MQIANLPTAFSTEHGTRQVMSLIPKQSWWTYQLIASTHCLQRFIVLLLRSSDKSLVINNQGTNSIIDVNSNKWTLQELQIKMQQQGSSTIAPCLSCCCAGQDAKADFIFPFVAVETKTQWRKITAPFSNTGGTGGNKWRLKRSF